MSTAFTTPSDYEKAKVATDDSFVMSLPAYQTTKHTFPTIPTNREKLGSCRKLSNFSSCRECRIRFGGTRAPSLEQISSCKMQNEGKRAVLEGFAKTVLQIRKPQDETTLDP